METCPYVKSQQRDAWSAPLSGRRNPSYLPSQSVTMPILTQDRPDRPAALAWIVDSDAAAWTDVLVIHAAAVLRQKVAANVTVAIARRPLVELGFDKNHPAVALAVAMQNPAPILRQIVVADIRVTVDLDLLDEGIAFNRRGLGHGRDRAGLHSKHHRHCAEDSGQSHFHVQKLPLDLPDDRTQTACPQYRRSVSTYTKRARRWLPCPS